MLAIDTSSPAVTAGVVAVGDGLTLAAVRAPLAPRGHGELLTPAVADCLGDAGIAASDLAAIVAGTGPGPYTGLRVGLVTAAALGQALAVPTYGVCSLDAIGAACADEPALLVATDARRREVYWARYGAGVRLDGPHVDRPAEVVLDGVTAVAGAAAELHPWPGLARRPEYHPEPVQLVALAADRIRAGAESEPLAPRYLRRPDAVVPGTPKRVSQ
ncbi:MAG TPA: tRNA (adenosine(37)-N6)-threonylcarbamoyltransferase complex dimerization subunit type 1 TsaB [Jatrophihabitans sp.]|nr:tRNA (adenosine(37)-N6)-threonylcarbamoyltransferase complex dimerization subunit type 1 TsaB [Jatrophihabitans sp.]